MKTSASGQVHTDRRRWMSVLPLPAGETRRDLLELPLIAVWIVERRIRLVGPMFGVRTGNAPSSQVVHLADLDAAVNEIGSRGVDVADDQ